MGRHQGRLSLLGQPAASTPTPSAPRTATAPGNGSRTGRASRSWPSRTPPASTSPTIPDTTGLGYLGHSKRSGLWLHSALAVTAAGVPLGLIDQRTWTRDPATLGKRAGGNKKETAEKESQRWLDALAATEAAVPAGPTVVTVADREADFYDLFAAPRRPGSHLLIRAKPRRRVRHVERLLGRAVRAAAAAGTMAVELRRGDDRPPRRAVLTIRFATLEIAPPSTHPRRKELPHLRLTAILAEEESPPAGQEPVCWWLVTTLPIAGLADAERAVRWYALRWLVERYHYVLKSGCRIERLQLETAARWTGRWRRTRWWPGGCCG